jgi:hypothetical protein
MLGAKQIALGATVEGPDPTGSGQDQRGWPRLPSNQLSGSVTGLPTPIERPDCDQDATTLAGTSNRMRPPATQWSMLTAFLLVSDASTPPEQIIRKPRGGRPAAGRVT